MDSQALPEHGGRIVEWEDADPTASGRERWSPFLRQRLGKTSGEPVREAKTLRQRAAEHEDKITIRIGYSKVSGDPAIQTRADAGRIRLLQKEIENLTQQAEICEELAQRTTAGGP